MKKKMTRRWSQKIKKIETNKPNAKRGQKEKIENEPAMNNARSKNEKEEDENPKGEQSKLRETIHGKIGIEIRDKDPPENAEKKVVNFFFNTSIPTQSHDQSIVRNFHQLNCRKFPKKTRSPIPVDSQQLRSHSSRLNRAMDVPIDHILSFLIQFPSSIFFFRTKFWYIPAQIEHLASF